MKRLLVCGTVVALVALLGPRSALRADDKEDRAAAKAALQALNDYIGEWKGNGGPLKANPASRDLWSETVNWSWRFKGDDAWLVLDIKDGKYYKGGEMHFLPDTMRYQLTLTDKADKKEVFEGEIKDDILTLERTDPATKETQQLTMNLAGEGVRLIYRFAHKRPGSTLFVKDYQVACNKAGASLGGPEKKNECVVSGGLGTMAISYKGQTYYVCCSGCKEAFMENPEKYIKEYEARKAGKK